MEPDTSLVSGIMLMILSIPALLAAWADRRVPVIGLLLVLGGIGLVVYGHTSQPGGYRLRDVPDVFFGVIGRMLT